jgi:hypothetical protein
MDCLADELGQVSCNNIQLRCRLCSLTRFDDPLGQRFRSFRQGCGGTADPRGMGHHPFQRFAAPSRTVPDMCGQHPTFFEASVKMQLLQALRQVRCHR